MASPVNGVCKTGGYSGELVSECEGDIPTHYNKIFKHCALKLHMI